MTIREIAWLALMTVTGILNAVITVYGAYLWISIDFDLNPVLTYLFSTLPLLCFPTFLARSTANEIGSNHRDPGTCILHRLFDPELANMRRAWILCQRCIHSHRYLEDMVSAGVFRSSYSDLRRTIRRPGVRQGKPSRENDYPDRRTSCCASFRVARESTCAECARAPSPLRRSGEVAGTSGSP